MVKSKKFFKSYTFWDELDYAGYEDKETRMSSLYKVNGESKLRYISFVDRVRKKNSCHSVFALYVQPIVRIFDHLLRLLSIQWRTSALFSVDVKPLFFPSKHHRTIF